MDYGFISFQIKDVLDDVVDVKSFDEIEVVISYFLTNFG